MSAASNHLENAILALIFNATAWANMADNAATSPHTALGVSMQTANPDETGTMSTSEAAYTGYVRPSVNRNSGGWTVSGTAPTQVVPVAAISGGACTGGTATITHFSVGRPSGGATDVFVFGAVSPTISVSNGVTPQLSTATNIQLA